MVYLIRKNKINKKVKFIHKRSLSQFFSNFDYKFYFITVSFETVFIKIELLVYKIVFYINKIEIKNTSKLVVPLKWVHIKQHINKSIVQ